MFTIYADDTVIFVHDVEQIPLILKTIQPYGDFMGLTLNDYCICFWK